MTTHRRYFVFLRAVNTGRRRLTNEQLLAPFLALGFGGVSAYQAAGNITFTAGNPVHLVPERIEPSLANAYGFEAPTFVRSSDELRAIVDDQPFTDDEMAGTDGKIQVTFMRTAPDGRTVTQVGELVPADDRVVIRGCRDPVSINSAGQSRPCAPASVAHRTSRRLDPLSSRGAGTTSHSKASSGTLRRGTGISPTLAKLATPTLAAVEERWN